MFSPIHTVARHTAESLSAQTVLFASMLFFQVFLGVDMGISSLMQTIMFELPNSRTKELEGTFFVLISLFSTSLTCSTRNSG